MAMNQNDFDDLPNDHHELKKLVMVAREERIEHQNKIESQQKHINQLIEIIRLFQHNRFGKSSEQSHDLQPELFDETEQTPIYNAADTAEGLDANEDDVVGNDAQPAKRSSGRRPLPAHLDRVIEEHDLPEQDKTCPCGCQKTHIGDEISEQLDIVPATVRVIQHRRKKYACKQCEEQGVETAQLPPQPIPKSNASPGLLAHVIVAKYQDGLPLYRMETIFKRLQIDLPRNTLANWMIKSHSLLQPLYNLLQDRLLQSGYIHMDETTVQVLKEADKPPDSKSYMWVRKTGDPDKPVVLFDYASRRQSAVAQSLLPDYQGYLQTDDYAGYNGVVEANNIVQLGCMAHARRKFIEAERSAPKGKQNKQKISKAQMAINKIKTLYAIETRIKNKPNEEKQQIREKDAKPILENLKAWATKASVNTTPKSKTGIALNYFLNNYEKLSVYLSDGRLNIDNNPVENAIRPFTIGRKNWMFSDSEAGAKASAMMYSVIETAKANNLEPYQYLRTVLSKLPQANSLEGIEQLLPWKVELLDLPKV